MKIIALLFFLITNVAVAQHAIGQFDDHMDIGNPVNNGSSEYDKTSKTYTMKGSGDNIWFSKDQFQFAYKKLSGDFVLTANFEFVGKGTNGHRKIGWMLRASADSDAVHYSAVVHGDGLTLLQWRPVKGAAMRDPEDEIFAKEKSFTTIQLERSGKKIIMRAAHAGESLKEIGSTTETSNLPDQVMAGLFICAHDGKVIEEAKVSNVVIARPPKQSR
jgi:TolB protein